MGTLSGSALAQEQESLTLADSAGGMDLERIEACRPESLHKHQGVVDAEDLV